MDHEKNLSIDESKIITQEVNCPFCKSDQYTAFLRTNNMRRGIKKVYTVAQCSDCDFRYIKNPPTQETMKYCYPPDYYSLKPEKISLVERIYYSLFRTIEKTGGTLLDVGCGNCKYLNFMKNKGWDVHGYDPSPIPESIKQDYNIIAGDLLTARIEDNSFDVITLWWSIEHMLDPVSTLKKCFALLKNDGLLIIATSNSASLEARLFKNHWHHLNVPEHCQQFTDKSLSAMVRQAGFSVTRIKYDLISLGIGPSLDYVLRSKKITIPLLDVVLRILCIPLEIYASLTRQSGLITLYATKRP